MHLFNTGIMRRLLSFLFGSKRGRNIRRVTLPNATQIFIDIFLVSLRKYISRLDFARLPKSIKHLGHWKASDLRIFLHYLGVVILKPYLPKAFYDLFLFMLPLNCFHVLSGVLMVMNRLNVFSVVLSVNQKDFIPWNFLVTMFIPSFMLRTMCSDLGPLILIAHKDIRIIMVLWKNT